MRDRQFQDGKDRVGGWRRRFHEIIFESDTPEGKAHGFTSIPVGVYWAVVTLTTVGYGDIAPQTALGKVLASFAMIMGYGIIAVPTGIVTAELTWHAPLTVSGQSCPQCSAEGHDSDAIFCRRCGSRL